MSANETRTLLNAAESIADGTEELWTRLLDDEGMEAGVAQALQAIGKIAAFHRSISSTETRPIEAAASASIAPWGHLSLLGKIDEGAFGSVYRARDPNLQIDVALKLVANRHGHEIDVARALKEARLLARVRHPNVVQVYGADIVDGRVGIWMELIHGQTLATLLEANGPLGAREAALIGVDLCQALAAVHAANLIHGDVKATNVMREAGGRIVLMDFGTSKDLGIQPSRYASGIDVAGTPLYLAPEVFRGATRSRVTDLYSLGVLLFHLVSTSYPVNGSTKADVEDAHERGARIRLRDVRPDLPPRFIEAIERAIAPAPADRFQSVAEFESALLQSLERHDRRVPRARTYWWLAAVSAVVIAAVAGGRYWVNLRAARTAPRDALTGGPIAAGREVAAAASTYQIDAALYRLRGTAETRLRSGDRVAPGDRLFAKLQVSTPAFVYIVNEDDQGQMFLLFPLPGQAVDNPIAPGASTRIPGTINEDLSWQITSVGGREHFLIFASPQRLDAFEDLFATLPRPTFGQPVTTAAISPQVVTKLRGVGGLAQPPGQTSAARLAGIFSSPLGDREETAHGLWVRQLTVENPTKP